MSTIDKINDKFFKNVFTDIENTRPFLKKVLPAAIIEAIDFPGMAIDLTNYVSTQFKEGFADVVVKTTIKTRDKERRNTDIYILMEHKSYRDTDVLVQLLMYMALMWQKDADEKKPLRVIIPLVFYHGQEAWNIPLSFAETFDVEDALKQYLLDYPYLLFDTHRWNMKEESNPEIRRNVLLFTALALMKYAYNENLDGVADIFQYWRENGFVGDSDRMLFFLVYLTTTKKIPPDQLKKLMEENKIDGGDLMETIAEQWMKDGETKGILAGILTGKLQTASQMLNEGFSLDLIMKCTGLTQEQLKPILN